MQNVTWMMHFYLDSRPWLEKLGARKIRLGRIDEVSLLLHAKIGLG